MFVQRDIFDDFTQAVADAAAQAKIGPGLDPTTELGPLVSQEQFDRVSGYIEARAGRRRTCTHRRKTLGRERLLHRADRRSSTSNPDSPWSTKRSSARWWPHFRSTTKKTSQRPPTNRSTAWPPGSGPRTCRAHRTAAAVQAGSVWVNQFNGFDTALPFGGFKQSGWGRELGDSAIDLYTQVKAVNIAL